MFPDGSMKAAQLHKDASGYPAELLKAQARVAELESQVSPIANWMGTTGDPGEGEGAMSAPDSIRGTGERGETSLSRDVNKTLSAAVGALSLGQHKVLLSGCPTGPDSEDGADSIQPKAGEAPAAPQGGLGSSREHLQVPGCRLCSLFLSGPCLQPCPSPWGGSGGVLPKSIPGVCRHRAMSMWTWWGQRVVHG